MVDQVATWASRFYPMAQVYGAWDGEPSWSTYTKAHDWMHGYDVLYPARRALYATATMETSSQLCTPTSRRTAVPPRPPPMARATTAGISPPSGTSRGITILR